MKYEIGDTILVLHSNEEGKVIEIMNDKMVMIEVRGVKFPAYMDQIDFPYFKRFTEKKLQPVKKEKVFVDNIPKEKPKPNTIKVSEGVWLSLIPKFGLDEFNDEIVELFKIHLVNKTDKIYNFTYKQLFFGDEEFVLKNQIHAFQDFYLHDMQFEDLNDSPQFDITFELSIPEKKKADAHLCVVKIKPKQMFQRIEEMKRKNEPTISFELFTEFPDKELDNHIGFQPGNKNITSLSHLSRNAPAPRSVVDLHIEKLMNDFKGLSNFEILTIQIKEFEKWYDAAILHRMPNLIIIHGVGKGKLRDEIHELLKLRKEVKTFVNQYHPQFGYGATEIFFKY